MSEQTRIHKIGTVTLGITLVLFGILFTIHIFLPALSFSFIFKLWPFVFIFLGIEILCSHFRHDMDISYDFASVVLLFFLMAFAAGMGLLQWIMENFPEHIYFDI